MLPPSKFPSIHDDLGSIPTYSEVYESEDEETAEDVDEICAGALFVQAFAAREIVDLAAMKHAHTIKHLAISMTEHCGWVWQNERIINFHAFSRLTHLEYNIDAMRPSRVFHMDGNTKRYLPRSITKILPRTIQVVRIVVRQTVGGTLAAPQYAYIHKLLRRVPHERNNFPDLRKIHLRLSVLFFHGTSSRWPHMYNEGATERSSLLGPIRDAIEAVGISLTTEFFEIVGTRVAVLGSQLITPPIEHWDD